MYGAHEHRTVDRYECLPIRMMPDHANVPDHSSPSISLLQHGKAFSIYHLSNERLGGEPRNKAMVHVYIHVMCFPCTSATYAFLI